MKTRSDSFSPRFQCESVNGVEGPMTSKDKRGMAARESPGAADHATRLLTLQFSSLLHGLFASSGLYTLDDDKPLEGDAGE